MPYPTADQIELDQEDFLEFESNTQILEDESMDIASVVLKIQKLARRHV